jgi:hypothetical protein
MASSIQILRSNTAKERPFPGNLLDGQPALNTNSEEPGLFFKTTNGSIVKIGPAAITSDGNPPNTGGVGQLGNTIGELWLDKSVSPPILKVYDGAQWVNAGSGGGGGAGTFVRWVYTAIGGETSLSGSSAGVLLQYQPGLEEVFINGVLITRGADYNAFNGSNIIDLQPLTAGDVVTVTSVIPLSIVELPGQVTLLRWSTLATAGQTVLSGADSFSQQLAYTAGLEEVYVNGAFLRRDVDYTAADGLTISISVPLALNDEITVLAWTPFEVGSQIVDANVDPNAGIVASKLSFTQAGSGAVSRSIDSKLQDEVSVKDFGAVGDGTTDDTLAIQNAINSNRGTVFFPRGTYKTTSPILITGTSPSLRGAGKRTGGRVGINSRIFADHDGDAIRIFDRSLIGIEISELTVSRRGAFDGKGVNIAIDNLPTVSSPVISHVNLRRVYSESAEVGLLIRGLIFGTIESCMFFSNKYGIDIRGDIAAFPRNNGTNFHQCNVYNTRADGAGIRFSGQAGRNIFFNDCGVEGGSGRFISIEPGTGVENLVFNGLWLEGSNNLPMKLAGGDWIYFNYPRFALNRTPIDPEEFAAKNVFITGMYGGGVGELLPKGVLINQQNYIATRSTGGSIGTFVESNSRGNQLVPSMSCQQLSGESISSPFKQSGPLTRNVLTNWDIPNSGAWNKASLTNLSVETDPLGGLTAYSWNGNAIGAIQSVFLGEGDCEMTVWACGEGNVQIREINNNNARGDYRVNISSGSWVRLSSRFNNQGGNAIHLVISLDPVIPNGIKIWRPGMYSGVSNIDSRPFAISSVYEGGYIDFDAYPYGERMGTNFIVLGSSPPISGSWMIGDKVVNSSPSPGSNEGWVCTTTGTPGTWKSYGSISA